MGAATQIIIDAVSLAVLSCALAASLRITIYRSFEQPWSRLVYLLTHPAWCLTLLFFIPWTIAGFAKNEISYLPWQAFADHTANGLLDASAFGLCVAVVDLWMFVTAGQLAIMMVNKSPNLTEPEKAADRLFFIAANLLFGVLIVMQASNLYYVFAHVSNITLYFMVGIALLAVYFHSRFTPFVVSKAPAILTTCGILGTFLGIAIGLMDFDPSAVQRSVPALIEGIKTAFWASACGIFFALTIKLREVLFGGRLVRPRSRATIDDLVAVMESIQQSLAGREESSLYGLTANARQDYNARLDALVKLIEATQRQPAPAEEHKSLSLAAQN